MRRAVLYTCFLLTSLITSVSAQSIPPTTTAATCGKPVCTWVPFAETVTRQTGSPATVSADFNVLNPNTTYSLQVADSGVASATISLNGTTIFGTQDFNATTTSLQSAVAIVSTNSITATLQSKPGTSLDISVIGVDNDPPQITAQLAPATNIAGWNNSSVVVTFTCSDMTSGIAICPPAVTLSNEAANQPVTATAFDNAGNSSTISLAVSIDKTPPVISKPRPPMAPPPALLRWRLLGR